MIILRRSCCSDALEAHRVVSKHQVLHPGDLEVASTILSMVSRLPERTVVGRLSVLCSDMVLTITSSIVRVKSAQSREVDTVWANGDQMPSGCLIPGDSTKVVPENNVLGGVTCWDLREPNSFRSEITQ